MGALNFEVEEYLQHKGTNPSFKCCLYNANSSYCIIAKDFVDFYDANCYMLLS